MRAFDAVKSADKSIAMYALMICGEKWQGCDLLRSGEHRGDKDKVAQTEFANNNASVGRVVHVPLGATRAPCPKKMHQLDIYDYYGYTI